MAEKQKVLVLGGDGYLGWPLNLHLLERGHEVTAIDCYFRRNWVKAEGAKSATPIKRMDVRLDAALKKFGKNITFFEGDIAGRGDDGFNFLCNVVRRFRPDTIVHLAEMPSAPFSMIDFHHCWDFTHKNNMKSTLAILFAMRDICPNAHLVKLGTMGEYGYAGFQVPIPEGRFDKTAVFRGYSMEGFLFPRHASSWYHQTKVHDTNNIEMACRMWGLKVTDIMQGVVYGTRTDEMTTGDVLDEDLCTRFDFGECFGTAINRFCAQAVIGHPLTLFGKGHQKRGFLPLRDSIQCLTLAIENPPIEGEHGCKDGLRILNQFEEQYDLTQLANRVVRAANKYDIDVKRIGHVENPRVEAEEHFYEPDHQYLLDLGYQPTHDMDGELELMFKDLLRFQMRIKSREKAIMPKIGFKGDIRPFEFLDV